MSAVARELRYYEAEPAVVPNGGPAARPGAWAVAALKGLAFRGLRATICGLDEEAEDARAHDGLNLPQRAGA
jgi:hypothetical protein